METMRTGIAQTLQEPKRFFEYTFVPRYNDTLDIYEVPPGFRVLGRGKRKRIPLRDCPMAIQAEINISLGHAGLEYFSHTWWERRRFDFAAWRVRMRRKLTILRLKAHIWWQTMRFTRIVRKR